LHSNKTEFCEDCGKATGIGLWPFCPHGSVRHTTGYQEYPYTTKNLTADGKEVEVTGKNHEKALMQQYQRDTGNTLVKRDDVAFLGESYDGYNREKDRQEYSSGSGRGMPGQWI
jgi:hypothetical protein